MGGRGMRIFERAGIVESALWLEALAKVVHTYAGIEIGDSFKGKALGIVHPQKI